MQWKNRRLSLTLLVLSVLLWVVALYLVVGG